MTPRPAILVALFVAGGCGARSPVVATEDAGVDAAPPNAVEVACDTQRFTRASTCEAKEAECSTDGACGTCGEGESCTRGRCLHFVGLPVVEHPQSQADLGRGLYDVAEGMECALDVDGDLERVEAGLSSDGKISAVVMSVFADCGGRLAKVAEQRRATVVGESRVIEASWTLEPPIAVKKGTTVRVVFRAEGSSFPSRAAGQQIARRNAVAACRFHSDHGAQVTGGKEWDFLGRVGIHPR